MKIFHTFQQKAGIRPGIRPAFQEASFGDGIKNEPEGETWRQRNQLGG